MAPLSKKAKTTEKGSGSLTRFFGGPPKEAANAAPEEPVKLAPEEPVKPAPEEPVKPAPEQTKSVSAGEGKGFETPPPRRALATPQEASPLGDSSTPPPVLPLAEAALTASKVLTADQSKRIEENKRKALEKKRAREAAAGVPTETPPAVAPKAAAAAAQAPPAKPVSTTKPAVSPTKPAVSTVSPTKPAGGATAPKAAIATPEKPKDALATPEKPQGQRVQASAGQAGASSGSKYQGKTEWEQYNNLYMARLRQLGGAAREQAKLLWGGMVAPNNFVADLTGYRGGNDGSEVVVVGVLYKDLKKRPNVVDEYKQSKGLGGLVKDENAELPTLYSEEDTLWIEDHMMRVQLALPKEQIAGLATGLVVAVRGVANKAGALQLAAFCLPKLPVVPKFPAAAGEPKFLALLSGLAFGSPCEALAEARNNAFDFLLGQCEDKELALLGQSVQEVVICGGSFADQSSLGEGGMKAALQQADDLMTRLADVKSVQVMPGRGEPTSMSLPQMPFSRQLFRLLKASSGFRPVSNPANFSTEGVDVVGHSGQPVEDLLCCARMESPLQALVTCLEARHLAPTAPDTLATAPWTESDPFVMDSVPHVLFSGGHRQAAHEWHPCSQGESGTQCVCVPAFKHLPAVVLINLRNVRDIRVQEFRPLVKSAA
mmetsp:Transcript_71730/g.115804  ORF Transcript_71730/g.115804 Transcript_71730/m.115804 type:complete len:658 (-) Transcript_71730:142-2115(-)|eukprot:CAMPEP_0115119544 /NCGR_PEP_ID=MMETSP0227-20121206/45154_1 /TAXON_ID=89957 /ORGANISM="Polarella glacialis, Strain CCMP 1383" /LENGTH=657 /DNA_ID=CAMNT_0002521033 /DNA_START=53 /DNA_END=2026 /DNA_ORIENTATION=+